MIEFYGKRLVMSKFNGVGLLVILSALSVEAAVRSPSRDWGTEFEVKIKEDKIWTRPRNTRNNGLNGSEDEGWSLFRNGKLPGADIHSIAADGDNLIALSTEGRVYYTKFSQEDWSKRWGKPIPFKLMIPEKTRAWAISHRGDAAGGYEDIDGRFHPTAQGVTTLYALDEKGTVIRFADPWLPSGFNYKILTPERGRFVAVNMDASASTLFVVDRAGRMYTRLADYDTLGQNPFLSYSYESGSPLLPPEVRMLPNEDWRRQPDLPWGAQMTSRIWILQTGKGNAARRLYVLGTNPRGEWGVYSKMLDEMHWSFTREAGEFSDLFLDRRAEPQWGQKTGLDYAGSIQWDEQKLVISAIDFNPELPSTDVFVWDGKIWVKFVLYTRKKSFFRSEVQSKKYQGAMIPSWEYRTVPWVAKLFKDRYAIEVTLKRSGKSGWMVKGETPDVSIKLKMNPGQVSYPAVPGAR